jgi:hypothetical protein
MKVRHAVLNHYSFEEQNIKPSTNIFTNTIKKTYAKKENRRKG